MTNTPLFRDMDAEQLRSAYRGWRESLYGWGRVAQPRRNDGGRSADGTGRALRNVEMIEAIARKRGFTL